MVGGNKFNRYRFGFHAAKYQLRKFIKSKCAKSYKYKLRFVGKQSEKFHPNRVFDARLHVEVKL